MTRAGVCIALWVSSATITVAAAQEAEPIRCWWHTSAGAVATGEPFDVTLTCAVIEDAATSVVPDETRLGAAAIQLAPFEILGGSHPADLRTPAHRFLQYHYTVRVIDADAIGADAKFPDVQIHYRVRTRVEGEAAEGRDRIYILPGQSVRVLSLVPADAADIRDTSGEDLAMVDALRFRARALNLAALTLVILGGLVLAPALVRLTRRATPAAAPDAGRLAPHVALDHADQELAAVQHESAGGWTPELAARAAAAVRIVAAAALGKTVAHQPHSGGTPAAGRLTIHRGWRKQSAVTASSAVTATDLAKESARVEQSRDSRQRLETLQRALTVLTSSLYGPAFAPDESALNTASAEVRAVVRTLRRAQRWRRSNPW